MYLNRSVFLRTTLIPASFLTRRLTRLTLSSKSRWMSNVSLAELKDGWMERLRRANVPEPELSLKYITDHVIGKDKVTVCMIMYFSRLFKN